MQHLVYAARLAVGGCAAAVVYLGETVLESVRVVVATTEEIDADDEGPDEPDAVSASLTGLDAERFVNDLRSDYHDADELAGTDDNCGHHDCRWCWVNATGATG